MLRVGRSGGCTLIKAARWESIKIGRSQRLSVASTRHVAARSAALGALTRGPSHPAAWQHSAGGGDRRCARGITRCGRLRTSPRF
jgi:hypothetical protein